MLDAGATKALEHSSLPMDSLILGRETCPECWESAGSTGFALDDDPPGLDASPASETVFRPIAVPLK
jgi:hypothetical protein